MVKRKIELAPELASAVGFGLRRATTISDTLFAGTFSEREISAPQYAILLTVRKNPGCQPSVVAGLLRISPNNLVPHIDDLVGRGYVSRSLGASDRRVRHLRLTEAGEQLVKELVARHEEMQGPLAQRMGEDKLRELVRLLELYIEASGV